MKSIRYHLDLGATAACINILVESTKVLGKSAFKGSARGRFLFVSLFSSKKAAEAAASIVVDLIFMVKINTK